MPTPSTRLPTQESRDTVVETSVAELHRLVNVQRRIAGCEPLGWHEPTALVAESHSRDMDRRGYFEHVTPEGTDLAERLLAGGVTWHGSIAENLALTPAGPGSALDLWLESAPHRRHLESCSFTHHGIGRYRDHWTQVLIENPAPP